MKLIAIPEAFQEAFWLGSHALFRYIAGMKNFPTRAKYALKCRLKLLRVGAGLGLLCLSLLTAAPAAAQTVREYVEADERQRYEALLNEYGSNKVLPPGYELQALLALSHYPELKDVRIRCIGDDVDIPLNQ